MIDWNARKERAFERALRQFRTGQEFRPTLAKVAAAEIMAMKQLKLITHAQILVAPNGCAACAELRDRAFTLDDALALAPLPVLGCGHEMDGHVGWCRCLWLPVIDPE